MQPLSRRTAAACSALTALGIISGAALGSTLTDRGDLVEQFGGAGPLGLAVTLATLLWLQRSRPLTGLALAAATIIALRVSHLTGPDSGWLWPATLLYAQAALTRRTAWVVTIAVVHAWTAFSNSWTVLGQPVGRALADVGTEALWLAAVIAATVSYRNWRRWQTESLQRLRTEAEEQRAAERLRLAREVHDAVAHTLAVVGLHVNVAADALDTDPEEARAALRLAQDIRRRAMADLSALVGILRSPDGAPPPPVQPPPLAGLVAGVRATGLVATLEVTGDEETIPLPIRLTAAAVVREALTNVVKHANATHVTVQVHYGPSTVVTVRDDGTGPQPGSTGHGLSGLTERVTALGGTLTAGPPIPDAPGHDPSQPTTTQPSTAHARTTQHRTTQPSTAHAGTAQAGNTQPGTARPVGPGFEVHARIPA
jgi:signal transduction histidine kinase